MEQFRSRAAALEAQAGKAATAAAEALIQADIAEKKAADLKQELVNKIRVQQLLTALYAAEHTLQSMQRRDHASDDSPTQE